MSEIYSKYSPPHENKETWSKKEYHPLTEMYCKMYGIKYNGKSKTEQKYVSIHSCDKCNLSYLTRNNEREYISYLVMQNV